MTLYLGTAGWTIPRKVSARFVEQGTHLERYAAQLNAVEINSSFYRSHQRKTYARWANCTPAHFRFSVKLPKRITHEARLVAAADDIAPFVEEVTGLGEKLGAVLVQLPPSLQFETNVAHAFCETLRQQLPTTNLVFEPRHASWFTPEVDPLWGQYGFGRVAADPPPVSAASEPSSCTSIAYYRLHGSPRVYYSTYEPSFLASLVDRLARHARRVADTWCIFDNTALGAATENVLEMQQRLRRHVVLEQT